ncbi:MAG TPA: histidine kinase [Chthoniobacterales bacterium]
MRLLGTNSKWQKAFLFILLWTLIGLIFSTISYVGTINQDNTLADTLRLNLVQYYLWAGFSFLIFWFSRRFPIELRPVSPRNLLVHIPALLCFAASHQTVNIAFIWFLTPRLRQFFPSLASCYRAYFGFGFYLDLIIASLIVIASHALLYYQGLRESKLAQSSLQARLAEAQLRALKMQLQPHFLFNTLHSISSLVLEDPPRANAMIARLGDFLRLTLEHTDEQMVTLKEEIEFLRCYLEIEQVRFGDRLTVNFRMEPATLAANLPHLILQPVVENAIQHAVAPRAAPGRIDIEAKRSNGLVQLEVRDTGPGLRENTDSVTRHGVGLRNVIARLEQTYGSEFSFEMKNGQDGGLTVTMELPFRSEET